MILAVAVFLGLPTFLNSLSSRIVLHRNGKQMFKANAEPSDLEQVQPSLLDIRSQFRSIADSQGVTVFAKALQTAKGIMLENLDRETLKVYDGSDARSSLAVRISALIFVPINHIL
jgi:hypothetical protein